MKKFLLLLPVLIATACTMGDNESHTRGDAAHVVLTAFCRWDQGCRGDAFRADYGDLDNCVGYFEVYYREYINPDEEHGDWNQVLECEDDLLSRACSGEFPDSCVNVLDL